MPWRHDYSSELLLSFTTKAEITTVPPFGDDRIMQPVLSLVVRILKREVRAFGGCLGMHRR